MLGWHVHQKHSRYRSLGLTIAVRRVMYRVCLQNPKQILLPNHIHTNTIFTCHFAWLADHPRYFLSLFSTIRSPLWAPGL